MILDREPHGWSITEVDARGDSVTEGDGSPGDFDETTALDTQSFAIGRFGSGLAAQAAVVLVVSGLAGLAVYFLVQTVFDADGDSGVSRNGEDGSELSEIQPGPFDGSTGLTDDEGASGSRRTSASDGRSNDGSDPPPAATDETTALADRERSRNRPIESERAAGPTATADGSIVDPTGLPVRSSGLVDGVRPRSSPASAGLMPPPAGSPLATTPRPTAAPAPRAGSSSPTAASRTAPSTAATMAPPIDAPPPVATTAATTTITTATTTTAPTTSATTAAPTTTAGTTTTAAGPPMPAQLVASPANGASSSWAIPTQFRANPVPGAESYCWHLQSGGSSTEGCRGGTIYTLPPRSRTIGPGLVTVTARAYDEGGALLMSQTLTITLTT